MPTVKLDSTFLKDKLICPLDKPKVEFVAEDLPGMYLLVTAASPGKGTYFYRWKSLGKLVHVKIGRTTEIGLAEARKAVIKLKGEIASGKNPHAEEKARKAVMTFSDFFKNEYLGYCMPRKKSWRRDEEMFRLRLEPEFGSLRLTEISRRHVQNFHASLVDEKGLSPATADHHAKLLRSVLNRAVEWEIIERNVLKGIKLFSVCNQIDNVPDEQQMERLLTVLTTDANRTVCLIALFLLSTGCRLNEALQAKWSQISEENLAWRIPAANTKSKRGRTVPLNPTAIHVIKQLNTKGEFDHLFINRQTKRAYTTVFKVWSRIREKAGLKTLRLHDLRHSYASALVSNGYTLHVTGTILGHLTPKVTMRYAHVSNKALLEAANSASVLIKPDKSFEAA